MCDPVLLVKDCHPCENMGGNPDLYTMLYLQSADAPTPSESYKSKKLQRNYKFTNLSISNIIHRQFTQEPLKVTRKCENVKMPENKRR
jgi:hypothetical protein